MSPLILGWTAVTSWYCGVVDEAVRWVGAGMRVAPDSPWVHWCGGYVLAAAGKRDEALVLLDRAAASGEALMQDFATLLARTLRGEPVERLATLERSPVRLDPHGSQIIAETYAAGGRRTEALDWLRNAISLGVVNGTYMAARSPFFASLRGDPEFQALVGEARARAARERI